MENIQAIVQSFLDAGAPAKDPTYAGRVENSDRIRLHAEGYKAEQMLELYRPNLNVAQRQGQLANARLITQTHFARLVNTFSKVLTAQDYHLSWSDTTGTLLAEQLEKYREYTTQQYPYGTLDEWIMQQGLPAKLIEAGGVYAIVPSEKGPVVKAFRAEQVKYHIPGHLCIVSTGSIGNESYLVYTPEITVRYVQVKGAAQRKFEPQVLYQTYGEAGGYKWMFAQPIGGRVVDISQPNVQASLVAGVLPYWDEAFVNNFDRAQSVRDHAYPLAWAFVQSQCQTCNGTGNLGNKGLVASPGKQNKCSTCNGVGVVQQLSPYGMLAIRPSRANEEGSVPTPPMGYVQRDIAPLEFLSNHIREMVYQGYSALGLEYLGQEQLNQSGIAKDYDREPVRATLRVFAESFIGQNLRWIDTSLALAMFYADGLIYTPEDVQDAASFIAPTRTIPNEFDVLTISTSQSVLKAAREAGADAYTLASLEQQFALRAVGDDVDLRQIIELRGVLDPMSGYTLDQKITLRDTGAVTLADFVVSTNIERFIARARRDNPNFDTLAPALQEAIIYGYAEKQIAAKAAPAVGKLPPYNPETEQPV